MIFYINENVLFNEKDIYYNKEAFDNGDINLCFITGHSGSGKSTMGNDMANDKNIVHQDLDDLLFVADHSTLTELKENNELMYSYFSGLGNRFYVGIEDFAKGYRRSEYDDKMFPEFVHYAMKYAEKHKNKKFVIEGVWLYRRSVKNEYWFDPEEFKDYAFYIKGTSMLISKRRRYKRDIDDAKTPEEKRKALIRFLTQKWKTVGVDESSINRFRKYFINLMKNK